MGILRATFDCTGPSNKFEITSLKSGIMCNQGWNFKRKIVLCTSKQFRYISAIQSSKIVTFNCSKLKARMSRISVDLHFRFPSANVMNFCDFKEIEFGNKCPIHLDQRDGLKPCFLKQLLASQIGFRFLLSQHYCLDPKNGLDIRGWLKIPILCLGA